MSRAECHIDGVIIKQLEKYTDSRGWLAELFRLDEIDAKKFPQMAYVSMTKPGVSRGPHEHREQTDYLCFTGQSRFRIYLWDNRPKSATYKRHCRFETEEGEIVAVIIPPGVVHAYKNIGAVDGFIINAPNQLYAGPGKKNEVDEIRHEDNPDSNFKIED
jgi:dTDP-4-dehydrorhamnose 3,5-epimerase